MLFENRATRYNRAAAVEWDGGRFRQPSSPQKTHLVVIPNGAKRNEESLLQYN